jgi:hypothetical protein
MLSSFGAGTDSFNVPGTGGRGGEASTGTGKNNITIWADRHVL